MCLYARLCRKLLLFRPGISLAAVLLLNQVRHPTCPAAANGFSLFMWSDGWSWRWETIFLLPGIGLEMAPLGIGQTARSEDEASP